MRARGLEYANDFIDATIEHANLDQFIWRKRNVVSHILLPETDIAMTVTEVDTVNNTNTTRSDRSNRIPLLATTGKHSYTLPDVAAIDAPELDKSQDWTAGLMTDNMTFGILEWKRSWSLTTAGLYAICSKNTSCSSPVPMVLSEETSAP